MQAASARADELLPYLEKEYNPDRNGAFWSTRPVLVTKRAISVGYAISKWLVQTRLSSRGGDWSTLTPLQAQRLREMLTDLGPAFVKIGQAVSSRPDVTPPDYLKELEKLQDQIPPFPDAEAMQVLRDELGRPPSHVFSSLTPSPVAAASLGQVYKGVLRSNNEPVAVKVQRPGVRDSIALDIFILRRLAGWFREAKKINSDLPSLLDEWATSLFRELDYNREAQNGMRFKQLFGDLEGVYVPHLYTDITTQRVLVMEWVEGTRLRSGGTATDGTGNLDDLKLVEIGVRCSLEQMLEEGYYHSDPHPGNLFKMADGRLAYIDFGMMGTIDSPIRRALIQATLHLVNREFDSLAADFITLGLLPAGSDRTELAPALTGVFQRALEKGVANLSFSDLSGELGKTMYNYGFAIPAYYTLLIRSLSVLEGIALSANKDYKVLGAAYPWIARRLLTERSEELRDTLRTLLYSRGRFQFARLESLLQQAVRSPARQEWVTKGGDRIRSETGSSALGLLLGPEGDFVREMLIEELAKGVDAALRTTLDDAIAGTRERLMQLLGVAGKEREVAAGQYRGLPGSLLLEGLLSLPALAGEDDRFQIDGINRLIRLMQEIAATGKVAGAPSQTAAAPQRQQLPSHIAAARQSVATARTPQQRWAVTSKQQGQPPQRPVTTAAPAAALQSPAQPAVGTARSPLEQVQQAAQMLQWFAQEAAELPAAARWEALRIPLSLASKVSSRIAARTLRTFLAPQGAQSRAAVAEQSPFTRPKLRPASSASQPALSQVGPQVAMRTPEAPVQEQSEAGPDPFIEDTAALIDSMERTSPSWVEGTNGAATSDVGPPAAAAPTASQQTLDPGLAPAGYSNASRSGNGAAKLAGADLPMVQFDEGDDSLRATSTVEQVALEGKKG